VETPQKNESGQDEQVVADINTILVNNNTTEHTVHVDPQNKNSVIKVHIRELSFIDMQKAIKSFISISGTGEVEIDLAGYWRYMYERCVVNTEPSLNTSQLLGLNQYVGSQLASILPQPQELMQGPLVDGNEE
jgi:hypothetical protein